MHTLHAIEILDHALTSRTTRAHIAYSKLSHSVSLLAPDRFRAGCDAVEALMTRLGFRRGTQSGSTIWRLPKDQSETTIRKQMEAIADEERLAVPATAPTRSAKSRKASLDAEQATTAATPKKRGRPAKAEEAMSGAERQRRLQARRRRAETELRLIKEHFESVLAIAEKAKNAGMTDAYIAGMAVQALKSAIEDIEKHERT